MITIIGKQSESRIELDSDSIKEIDKDGNTDFCVSNLSNRDGVATIYERIILEANSNNIEVLYPVQDIVSVTIDDTTQSSNDYSFIDKTIIFVFSVETGQVVGVEYTTTAYGKAAHAEGYCTLTSELYNLFP